MQINLDTNTLNKIESLRDSNRKAAMQDFEEWRSKAEEPILQNICGKVQKNRKEYRYCKQINCILIIYIILYILIIYIINRQKMCRKDFF